MYKLLRKVLDLADDSYITYFWHDTQNALKIAEIYKNKIGSTRRQSIQRLAWHSCTGFIAMMAKILLRDRLNSDVGEVPPVDRLQQGFVAFCDFDTRDVYLMLAIIATEAKWANPFMLAHTFFMSKVAAEEGTEIPWSDMNEALAAPIAQRTNPVCKTGIRCYSECLSSTAASHKCNKCKKYYMCKWCQESGKALKLSTRLGAPRSKLYEQAHEMADDSDSGDDREHAKSLKQDKPSDTTTDGSRRKRMHSQCCREATHLFTINELELMAGTESTDIITSTIEEEEADGYSIDGERVASGSTEMTERLRDEIRRQSPLSVVEDDEIGPIGTSDDVADSSELPIVEGELSDGEDSGPLQPIDSEPDNDDDDEQPELDTCGHEQQQSRIIFPAGAMLEETKAPGTEMVVATIPKLSNAERTRSLFMYGATHFKYDISEEPDHDLSFGCVGKLQCDYDRRELAVKAFHEAYVPKVFEPSNHIKYLWPHGIAPRLCQSMHRTDTSHLCLNGMMNGKSNPYRKIVEERLDVNQNQAYTVPEMADDMMPMPEALASKYRDALNDCKCAGCATRRNVRFIKAQIMDEACGPLWHCDNDDMIRVRLRPHNAERGQYWGDLVSDHSQVNLAAYHSSWVASLLGVVIHEGIETRGLPYAISWPTANVMRPASHPVQKKMLKGVGYNIRTPIEYALETNIVHAHICNVRIEGELGYVNTSCKEVLHNMDVLAVIANDNDEANTITDATFSKMTGLLNLILNGDERFAAAYEEQGLHVSGVQFGDMNHYSLSVKQHNEGRQVLEIKRIHTCTVGSLKRAPALLMGKKLTEKIREHWGTQTYNMIPYAIDRKARDIKEKIKW
jgi:hypothetical protein